MKTPPAITDPFYRQEVPYGNTFRAMVPYTILPYGQRIFVAECGSLAQRKIDFYMVGGIVNRHRIVLDLSQVFEEHINAHPEQYPRNDLFHLMADLRAIQGDPGHFTTSLDVELLFVALNSLAMFRHGFLRFEVRKAYEEGDRAGKYVIQGQFLDDHGWIRATFEPSIA